MAFKENLLKLIAKVKIDNGEIKDPALDSVIEILMTLEDVSDLKREKGLIVRIIIDSVENINIGEDILVFMNNYTKNR